MPTFISWQLEAANPREVKPRGDDRRKTGGAFVMAYMQMDYMCSRIKEEDERRFFPQFFPRETKGEKKREAPGEP